MTDERSAQVQSWCARARIDGSFGTGWSNELSDAAAVLIASARVDEPTRAILLARHRAARPLPPIGGYAALRRLSDELTRLQDRAGRLPGGAVATLIEHRAAGIDRRLRVLRATVESAPGHYASGLRAIRRDRRLGVHLEPDQRAAVAIALSRTPAPVAASATDQIRDVAAGVSARAMRRSESPMVARLSKYLPAPSGEQRRFADRYDTLLFLAGIWFDRIDGSTVWWSDYFAVQRAQLDLAEELVQIALDTVALQEIDTDLAAVGAAVTNGRELVEGRQAALIAVWDQLVDRVAALARIGDALATAEDRVRSLAAIDRTVSLDSRIDELIARSGHRELSAANTTFVAEQMAEPDEVLGALHLAVRDDIMMITARSRRA